VESWGGILPFERGYKMRNSRIHWPVKEFENVGGQFIVETEPACGIQTPYIPKMAREKSQVTCKVCMKTSAYRTIPV
jgi:hypothetical protein